MALIQIDRRRLFVPARCSYLGPGWKIAEPQDKLSLVLAQIDTSKIKLVTMLKKGEDAICGEERLRRLKAGKFIRLDAKIFWTFWENQRLIPKSWRKKGFIVFDGTPLQDVDGYRRILYLYWVGVKWDWDCNWLGYGFAADGPSAVLASD